MEIEFPTGAEVNVSSFQKSCRLENHGAASGQVCALRSKDARVGGGQMTVDMLGQHTVKGDAYRVDGGPSGSNLVIFFPSGQVFGVGAQSIFGAVSLDGSSPVRIRIAEIQSQLDLPFGATATLEQGTFTFSGEAGRGAFSMPAAVGPAGWEFQTVLRWNDGSQRQRVRATARE